MIREHASYGPLQTVIVRTHHSRYLEQGRTTFVGDPLCCEYLSLGTRA